jgi:multidrug transporter EmrE-like cation transporter
MSLPQIFALSCVEVVGDFALKEYANHGGLSYLAIGVGGYIGVVSLLIMALKGSTVLMVNGAWDGVSTIIESLAAYFILGERFDNYLQYIGLLFIIFGLYLLKVPWTKKHPFTIRS